MSGDETLALVVSGVLTLVLWGTWLFRSLRPPAMICPICDRWPLLVTPVLCALLLLAILLNLAAEDVRTDSGYILLYGLMGAAWVGLAIRASAILGISLIDILERRNRSAGLALSGAMVGLTLAFAGGNIGNGPGWWVVVFSSGLSTAGLLALWAVVDAAVGVNETVTIQRDRAAGIRLGCMLLAAGGVLGRCAAGDWHSAEATTADFARLAWPVLMLGGLEIVLGWASRPTRFAPQAPVVLTGWIPGLTYLLLAGVYLGTIGWWP